MPISKALQLDRGCPRYSLSNMRSATQNFNQELGRGGFGKVYKGFIEFEKGCPTAVAIKRLDSTSHQGAREFNTEIEMLSQLRHAHLVSLLGCCVDKNEMMIIYEFMPKGTLDWHLHKSSATNLPWTRRLMIGTGAAKGLHYLHTGTGTTYAVIHGDIKSSNILLDENWEAKISDFGMARICQTNQSTSHISTGVKGTYGYVDPDFLKTGRQSRGTDVYAVGVILFELLSGKQAVFYDNGEAKSLAEWAKNLVKKRNIDQLVAPEIRGQLCPNSLKVFAKIANCCLNEEPRQRPLMHEVLAALHQSLALQEKFDNPTKRARLFGFIRKMSCFGLPAKENTGDRDKRVLKKTKSGRVNSAVPTEDDGC